MMQETKNEMCSDLGVERAQFDRYWDEKEQDRYIGRISFTDSLPYVCGKCGKPVDDPTFPQLLKRG